MPGRVRPRRAQALRSPTTKGPTATRVIVADGVALPSKATHIDNRRPIDVLVLRGAAPLIEALDAIDAGT